MENHAQHIENEKRTLIVIIFTVVTMLVEIAYGYITNSMALLADGYHMGTHALALGLTYVAYVLARKFANSKFFKNGTEKIGILAGYTSSLFLGLTGFWIIYEAFERFIHPLQITFNDAILVAIIGLIVNAVCIAIMEGKGHSHHHGEEHGHDVHNEDYNLKAAYYHILADLLTSILAIAALLAGKYFNLVFLDSVIGALGGILILKWSFGLIKDTVLALLDVTSECGE